MKKTKFHKGKKQDCPKCAEALIGLEECFAIVFGRKRSYELRGSEETAKKRN